MKDNHSEESSKQQGEKSKLEQKLREANQKISSLESQKSDLQKQSEKDIEDLNSRITSLKDDLKKSALESSTYSVQP